EGTLPRGFCFPSANLVVLSAAELFGRFAVHPRRLSQLRRAERHRAQIDFSELNEDDLVVHLEHGVGKFLGLQKIPVGQAPRLPDTESLASGALALQPQNQPQEVLVLEFADEAKLYVPLEQAYLVSRYVGAGKKSPPLSSLGDGKWARAKVKAAASIFDYAGKMLAIQSEQKKVLQQLRQGGVDIIIGTHRLISGDLVFKDLGLVVIDEEQRFGVLHKEKFKELFKTVDVLTLSATPIPRTLYLSLVGAKDMSTIETPPLNRLPVETVVSAYDERIIRAAIDRELERQGQVFFLHNRVATIERARDRIVHLCPQARVEIGHGQMDADELEAVMSRFIAGKIDVLVCTTIIESGLDIPNANTIIIDRADQFGLADLYQLRGRVGRAEHKA